MLNLDHIALGANDLNAASKKLIQMLGVEPFGGGEHELFATHNKLWRIETPEYPIYMELIAANKAAKPQRPVWFGLGNSFPDDEIQLLGFIASTANIEQDVQTPPFDALELIEVSRGKLAWQFGVTKDGSLPADGALPYLINWHGNKRPLDGVKPQGIDLVSMGGARLAELGGDWPVDVDEAASKREKFFVELSCAKNQRLCFSR